MARKALVAQCGGPTAVINASLAAVIAGWQAADGAIWGARNGLRGLANGDWVELTSLESASLSTLANQTGSALGGGRDLLDAFDIGATVERLRAALIDVLFLIGGNGTMAAAQAIQLAAGDSLQVVGIPKTIDKDLTGTDLTPGFLSAAHFAIQAVRGAGIDLRSMESFDDVAIVEVMGRHAGWLTAATVLARSTATDAPHILLLPEAPIDEDALLARIVDIHRANGVCLVAASEGARNLHGVYLGELAGRGERDASGQQVFAFAGGVAAYLAGKVRTELGLRCRQLRPDTLYRTGGGLVSLLDRELAALVGKTAVSAAANGETSVMVGLRRPQATGVMWTTEPVLLDEVVGKERLLPPHFIAADGMDVTDEFRLWSAGLFDSVDAQIWW